MLHGIPTINLAINGENTGVFHPIAIKSAVYPPCTRAPGWMALSRPLLFLSFAFLFSGEGGSNPGGSGKKRAQCVSNLPRTGSSPLSGEFFAKCMLVPSRSGKKTRSCMLRGEICMKCVLQGTLFTHISPDRALFLVRAPRNIHLSNFLPFKSRIRSERRCQRFVRGWESWMTRFCEVFGLDARDLAWNWILASFRSGSFCLQSGNSYHKLTFQSNK